MAASKLHTLQMPSDPSSEIYFNSNTLSVDFRKKGDASKGGYQKMLRVIVQAYGQTIEDKFFKPGSTITFGVGSGSLMNVAVQNLPNNHPLLTYQESGSLTLRLASQFSGIIQMGDKLTPVSDLKGKTVGEFTIEIPNHPRGAIEQGTLRIYFEEIDDPERLLPVPFLQSILDKEFGKWLWLSLALHLALLLLIRLMPAPTEEEKKIEDLPKAFQKILVQPQEVTPYKPVIVQSSLTTKQANNNPKIAAQVVKDGGREGEGVKASGNEGRRGKAETGAQKPSMDKVKNAGVLSFFAQGGKTNDLVDGSVSDLADNLAKPNGGRFGLEAETEVRQGKGVVGAGTGGGNKTTNIGSGLGTQGRGGGKKGDGLADLGTGKSRTSVVASIDADAATVVGALSKDQIAKVISAYMGQIEYCYERQLQKEPNLRGKILVNFVIGLSGAVTSATTQSSSMGNPTVESCINGVFRRMPFPSPGAGIVEATYPLVFNVAG